MKKILTAILLLSSVLVMRAGDLLAANVPASVTSYVQKNFPQATRVEWDYEKKEGAYEADFKIEGREHELKLSPAGELISSEIDLVLSDLPSAVSAYLKTEHAKATLLGAKHVVHKGQVSYEVALVEDGLFGKKHRNLYLNEQGKRVSKPRL